MSFKLGFKVNPFLRRHGWKPGAGSDWETEATVKELSFWHDQGYEAVELIPHHHTRQGDIFDFAEDEWVKTRKVIEDSGPKVYGILGWRRMFFREPWVAEKARDLDKIANIAEIVGAKVIDILPGYSLPFAPSAGGPARPLFRSLCDATTSDFENAAKWLRAYAQRIAGFGVEIALELHLDTLTDVPPDGDDRRAERGHQPGHV